MGKNVVIAITLFVIIYITVGVLLFKSQRNFLYFPTPAIDHNFDEIIFSNENESISTIVINKGKEKAILYFGGNGESVASSAPDFAYIFTSHTVYLVNYRGYGGSSGKPEEKGLYSDAQYIFDQIRLRHQDVAVIGRSLGSGVATFVASKREIEKLVLITPFDSIQNVAQQKLWFYPMSILLKDKFDSLSRVKQIKAQTLLIIAEYDEVIGIKHTNSLVKAFPASQIIVETIENAGHNTLSADERYLLLLREFIKKNSWVVPVHR
jgi:pimeloyl-ACP methyl ester carboxylesterase